MKNKIIYIVTILMFVLTACSSENGKQTADSFVKDTSTDKKDTSIEKSTYDESAMQAEASLANNQNDTNDNSHATSLTESKEEGMTDFLEGEEESQMEETNPEGTSEEEGKEETTKIVAPLVEQRKVLENSYTKGETLIASVQIYYPEFENPDNLEGITAINQYFSDNAHALYEESDSYASDMFDTFNSEQMGEQDKAKGPISYQLTYEVTYNDKGFLSILEKYEESSGNQQRTNSYHNGYLFDVNSAEQLEIGDILLGSDKEIEERIGNAFLNSTDIDNATKSTLMNEMRTNTDYVDFYIDGDSVRLFYDAFLLAPNTQQTLTARIDLEQPQTFRIKIPKTTPLTSQ